MFEDIGDMPSKSGHEGLRHWKVGNVGRGELISQK